MSGRRGSKSWIALGILLTLCPLIGASVPVAPAPAIAPVTTAVFEETAIVKAPVEPSRPNLDIDPARYLGHISFLAHDELKGRGTGTNGIDLAAGYIAGQFAAAGLEPGGPGGTYLHRPRPFRTRRRPWRRAWPVACSRE